MKKTKKISRLLSLMLVVLMLFSAMVLGIPSAFAADTEKVSVAAESETKTYYFSPNGYWSNLFAVYAWNENTGASEWKQLVKSDAVEGLWSVELSASYTNAIFCSRMYPAYSWDAVDYKTDELTLEDGFNYLSLAGEATAMWGYYSAGDDSFTTETKKIYFTPGEEWSDIQNSLYHAFYVRAWNDENPDGVWAECTLVEGEAGVYPAVWEADIPADCDNVEFCRVENTADNSWYVWESTNEQTIPSESNRFTQNDDVLTGTWSFYEEPETEPSQEESSEPDSTGTDSPDPEIPGNTKAVYFTANENWLSMISQGIGSVYVYTWTTDADNGTWTGADALESTGVYKVDVPENDINIRFGLSYGTSPESVWEVTDDQKIPDDKNHFTQDEEGNSGTWSYYADTNVPAGRYYSVVFVNADNTLLKAQVVAEGGSAVAPANPVMAADEQYTYTFAGWDKSFSNVKSDLIVIATYTADVNEYIVTFIGNDGEIILAQPVAYGSGAEAPEAPAVEGYEFTGWDTEFDCVTKNIEVRATYKKVSAPVVPATTGALKVEVSGGTSFTIAVNGGAARPQGASYMNTKMPIGAVVTLTAVATNGAEFIGWINPANGLILTTDLTYTFTFTGNDFVKATFATKVDGVQLVKFYNDKSYQVVDMQYYASTDAITFPAEPSFVGYDFAGWSMTEAEIQAAIANGENVTVLATWTKQLVYVNVTVTGGTGGGKALANTAYTVTANEAPEGQKFAYWTDGDGNIKSYLASYKFFPVADIELIAVFVDADTVVEEKILASVDTAQKNAAGKTVFTYSWYCPDSYNFVDAGIIAVDAKLYNEATFYVGTSDTNVNDRGPSGSNIKPVNTFTWTKTIPVGDTWYAKCYVQYRDAEGNLQTVYSDIYEVVRD